MKRIAALVCVVAGATILSGCNNFEKILKSTDTELQYREAQRYYGAEKWDRASQLYERVLPMSRATNRGDTVFYRLSDCYFRMKDYEYAGYSFQHFTEQYPKSPFVEEAVYQAAFCSYKASPRPELDQSNTQQAITGFIHFKELYPLSERIPEVNGYLQEMYEKLQTKADLSAWLYFRQEKYLAAINAYRTCLETYPNGKYREKEMFYLLKSSYLYALNSVTEKQRERYQHVVDSYLSFFSEYRASDYMDEAVRYYRGAMRALGKSPDQNVLPDRYKSSPNGTDKS